MTKVFDEKFACQAFVVCGSDRDCESCIFSQWKEHFVVQNVSFHVESFVLKRAFQIVLAAFLDKQEVTYRGCLVTLPPPRSLRALSRRGAPVYESL